MTTAQVVETSVTVNNNSPIQDYAHPDDQTQPLSTLSFNTSHLYFYPAFINPFAPGPPVTARADPGPFYPL